MISLSDIYDKNVSFLLGSGASFGILPTLELEIGRADGTRYSIEDLATQLEESDDKRLAPLFMHYYKTCIRPAQLLEGEWITDPTELSVIANYERLLRTLAEMLQKKPAFDRTCNLFTTNYDNCISIAAENILRGGTFDFVVNDGTRGFKNKYLQARHFNSFLCNTGVFDRHQTSLPQINLIHLHGSVNWRRSGNNILVDYRSHQSSDLLSSAQAAKLKPFSEVLQKKGTKLSDLPSPSFTKGELNKFWASYKTFPIVNPTKWKFHETVYEEHYYQMLRFLSYELEKPNAVLITFGFSFADEHILNLVKRSVSNPKLQVYVCCFDEAAKTDLSEKFQQFRNVKCLSLDGGGYMTFSAFNDVVLAPPRKADVAGGGIPSSSVAASA